MENTRVNLHSVNDALIALEQWQPGMRAEANAIRHRQANVSTVLAGRAEFLLRQDIFKDTAEI